MKGQGITGIAIIAMAIVIIAAVAGGCYGMQGKPQPKEGINVGMIMWGYHDEGSWDPSWTKSVIPLKDVYNLTIGYSEGIQLQNIRDIVSARAQQDDLVILTTDEFIDGLKAVAPQYPDSAFAIYWFDQVEPGFLPANAVACRAMPGIFKANFLAGAVAGKMTETNVIGVVQAISGPRDTAYQNAFVQGVQYANPDAEVKRIVIGAYSDPPASRDAVQALYGAGADIVKNGMDDQAATKEAESLGIYSITEYVNVVPEYPGTELCSIKWGFNTWLEGVISALSKGNFHEYASNHPQTDLTFGHGEDFDVVEYGNMVPEDVRNYAEGLRNKLQAGEITIEKVTEWLERSPVVGQTG